ncbi:MAG TPA: hypothetical protein VFJ72_08600 [Rubrobacteraceae bacterium]|nr:hypothetical protein [Rubrobacteraceae bacterium]
MTEATTKRLGPCQVRSKTEHPCHNRAVVKIYGIPFCKACAREQEAYFAIGELTQEAQDLGSEPLVGAGYRVRREHVGI